MFFSMCRSALKKSRKGNFSGCFEACFEAMVRAYMEMKKREAGFSIREILFCRSKCRYLHDFWCYYTAMLRKTLIFAHGENSVQ